MTLFLRDRQDDFAGLTIRTELGTSYTGTAVAYRVDEAGARRAERLQPGYIMQFRGRIKSVNLLSQGGVRYRMRVELDERDITAPFIPITP